jgi:hypothetical protein
MNALLDRAGGDVWWGRVRTRGLDNTVNAKGGGSMSYRVQLSACVLIAAMLVAGCSGKKSEETTEVTEPTVLKEYPIAGTNDALTQSGVEADTAVTADGNGSLRITADQPTTVRLYETGDLDVEGARIVYQAKLRTEGVQGKVYLEMWCNFAGRGEYFARALQAPLSGSTEWTSQETLFFLKKGDNPDNVKLNVVIDGTGTVWVDDVRLIKGPLNNV